MKSDKSLLGSVGCIIAIIASNIILGGIATQYLVQFWGGVFTGHPVSVPILICALCGLFVGEFTVPAAIVTWLLSYVMHSPSY